MNLTDTKTAFVRMGWDDQGNKHPIFLEKWKDATVKTQEAIDAHFKTYKDAGIAILTGRESNLTVIDFDTKDNELAVELATVAPTYTVETKKGFHLYYQYRDDQILRQGTNRFSDGVDIRSDGGLVFAPPTPNYRRHGEDEVNELTDEAMAILRKVATPKKAPPKDIATTTTRNDSLFRMACGWVNVYDEQTVWNRMVKANSVFSKGELSMEELETIFQQVRKYAPKDARSSESDRLTDEEIDAIEGIEIGKLVEKSGIKHPSLESFPMTSIPGKNGNIYPRNTENIFVILRHHPVFKNRFRYDEWKMKREFRDNDGWRELDEDNDITPIQRFIQRAYTPFRLIAKETVRDAVADVCREHAYDSAVDWIRGIVWDRKPRIDQWLSIVYGVEENDYHRAVGSNWMKGMALRIIHPGAKFDSVIILKGRQGNGKTTSMEIIGGDWYAETTMKSDHKDFPLLFRGKMVIEFSEGHTLSASETQQMKAIISMRTDRYRDPYGRAMRDIPRRCVFAITTNQARPLKDETGNRRYFPIEVDTTFADIEWLKNNREQMFAEALYRVETLNERVDIYPESATDIQEANMEESPYEEKVRKWVDEPYVFDQGVGRRVANLADGILLTDVWENALGGSANRLDWRIIRNVGQAMRACGLERKRVMIGGEQKWRWFLEKK